DRPVRDAFLKGILGQLKTLASLRGNRDAEVAKREAACQLAMLVGSMALARATKGDEISDIFLDAGKEYLKAFPELEQ
ncbi:hypothetical protein, partial [Agrobacterium vitis]|uniref:hypothetical protein n=1 Tax=Agrobacterium vitis TaxID=373 RepID=UPI003B518525